MADAPKPPGRPMKYPYTYSAKIARFPYKFYFNNSWYFRYWCYSLVATFPLIVYLHKAGKWKELCSKAKVSHRTRLGYIPSCCRHFIKFYHIKYDFVKKHCFFSLWIKPVNSPANKRVWEEKRKHELEEARHHFENL